MLLFAAAPHDVNWKTGSSFKKKSPIVLNCRSWVSSRPSQSCCLVSTCDWHPGQPLPVHVQWGSDTCVARALRIPSALHIHQLVCLSAGRFIINSCWLVKSGPGCGTHTYIYIHCEEPLAVDGFQRPWTHPLFLNDGHSPESSNADSFNLFSPSHHLSLASLLIGFCFHLPFPALPADQHLLPSCQELLH